MNALTPAAVAVTERGPLQWEPIVSDMTNVQKLVHLLFRKTPDNVEQEREFILKHNRIAYEMTLEEEARSWGCIPGRAHLREGRELRRINERAQRSAKSIVNTYNYDLSKAILAIGADTPTANRYVYANRLALWEIEREKYKRRQISMAETFWGINQAKEDFYQRNVLLEPKAEVVPATTVCPICAEYVRGNPYPSIEELYRRVNLPAHVNCLTPGQQVTLADGTKRTIESVQRGELVMTHQGPAQVCQAFQQPHRGLVYRLEVGHRVLTVTGNHPVLTRSGWRPAQELEVGDEILVIDASWTSSEYGICGTDTRGCEGD